MKKVIVFVKDESLIDDDGFKKAVEDSLNSDNTFTYVNADVIADIKVIDTPVQQLYDVEFKADGSTLLKPRKGELNEQNKELTKRQTLAYRRACVEALNEANKL